MCLCMLQPSIPFAFLCWLLLGLHFLTFALEHQKHYILVFFLEGKKNPTSNNNTDHVESVCPSLSVP